MPRFIPEHRLFASALAGGGILDVGGYPVSMSRFVAGAASGKPFLDPIKVSGMANLNAALGLTFHVAVAAIFPVLFDATAGPAAKGDNDPEQCA